MSLQSPYRGKNGGRNGTSQKVTTYCCACMVLFLTYTTFFYGNLCTGPTPPSFGSEQIQILQKTIVNLRKELQKQKLELDELREKAKTVAAGAVEESSDRAGSLRASASTSAIAKSSMSAEEHETEEDAKLEAEAQLKVELGLSDGDKIMDEYIDRASIVAFSNTTTVAMKGSKFYSGFRNQIMAFIALVLQAQLDGHGQILLESLYEKDTYGSNQLIPFWRLWDVSHWNSHYPRLPRLVQHDPVLHDQWEPISREYYYDVEVKKFKDSGNVTLYDYPTRPYISGKQHNMFAAYSRYSLGNSKFNINGHRNPTEILMLQGAMRPHPKLRKIIDGLLSSLNSGGSKPIEYLTLHARIEPDMQKHTVCLDQKVLKLKEIFDWMQEKWPEPPVTQIFMPINREFLEEEGSEAVVERLTKENKKDKINWIAVENLRELNKARDDGLWQGRVKVFEFGSKALQNTEYQDRPSTTGALVNFFISIGAKIFIGTEVSSYSHDILATRFFRNRMENYNYLPDGLHHWTPPGLEDPPGFAC